jgi:hypothetical protein
VRRTGRQRSNASAIAARIGEDAAFGTIEIGNRADLLLLADDPFEEVGSIRNRLGVVPRGRWHPLDQLDAQVEALIASYAAGGRW